MKKKYSDSASLILRNKVGYRDDTVYGAYTYKFPDVLDFETQELGNTDIYATMRKLYGILPNVRRSRADLNDMVLWYCRDYFKCSCYDLLAIWLCALPSHVSTYYNGQSNNIRKVSLVEPLLLVSDLDFYGCLIVQPNNDITRRNIVCTG